MFEVQYCSAYFVEGDDKGAVAGAVLVDGYHQWRLATFLLGEGGQEPK